MEMHYQGQLDNGNMGVVLRIKRWYLPILFIRALFTKPHEIRSSCDGLEVTDVVLG